MVSKTITVHSENISIKNSRDDYSVTALTDKDIAVKIVGKEENIDNITADNLSIIVDTTEQEIIEISQKINTFETSILPYEDCCTIFTPKQPATKPRADKCQTYESSWDFESYVQDCIKNRERIIVTDQIEDEDDLF